MQAWVARIPIKYYHKAPGEDWEKHSVVEFPEWVYSTNIGNLPFGGYFFLEHVNEQGFVTCSERDPLRERIEKQPKYQGNAIIRRGECNGLIV